MNAFDPHRLEDERTTIEKSKRDMTYFEPLYLRYFEVVFRYVYRRTDDEALSADITSQTFYKAMVNLHQFTWQGKPLLSWLYTIAGNEVRKHFKHKREVFLIEEDKLAAAPELKEEWPAIKKAQLNRLLQQLKDQDLEMVELKFFEGLTFQEISVVLGKKESAVKMRIYRLLQKMKSQIQ